MALKNTGAHVNYGGYPLRGAHPQLEERERFRLNKWLGLSDRLRAALMATPRMQPLMHLEPKLKFLEIDA